LDYVHHRYIRWKHRFDDPEKQYRTLYCATERLTALREVLGDFRPNTKALAEFQEIFGPDAVGVLPAGVVSWAWRETNVLAPGRITAHGSLVDLDDVAIRQQLERKHAALLADHGMEHLDISDVRSTHRPVTQHIGRWLYEEGAAGVLYKSNRDDLLCVALFEGAAQLEADGPVELLVHPIPELLQVCDEYNLILRGAPGS
jgi:hypothetical protein